MQIFEYTDYRLYLRDWLKERKNLEPDLTFAQIAEDIGMQRPAFSKVLNDDTNFSPDQAFLLARRLQLSVEETTYFDLLIEHERTGLADRKSALQKQIIDLQRKNVSTPKSIDTNDPIFKTDEDRTAYFASPWTPVIHVFLTVPKYQREPELIRQTLEIPQAEFTRQLHLLERMGLIGRLPGHEAGSERWAATEKSIHGKDLSCLPAMQQLLFRSISLHKLSLIPLEQRYGLSVAFSTDEKSFEQARQILVKAVTEIHGLVSASDPSHVYHLSLDLFPWDTKAK